MKRILELITQVSIIKTIYTNFKLFPFKQAVILPIAIGRYTTVKIKRGGIRINSPVKPFMILFSIGGSQDLYDYQFKKSYLEIRKDATVIFNGSAHFGPHCSLFVSNSELVFGEKFSCNNGCRFSSIAGIEFGNDCLLGGNIVIRDSDGHSVYEIDSEGIERNVHENKKPVKIGNHVWIASECHILKGTRIPDDTVVAYGSLCTKAFDGEKQIIAGVPAKIIKSNINWKY